MIDYTTPRHLLEANNSAVRIQSRWRLCKAKADYRNVIGGITTSAATVIQALARSFKCQQVLFELRMARESKFVKAATTIQCFWRQHLRNDKAATVIQAFARSIKCQQVLLELRLACDILCVITLQAVVRSWICRRQLATLKHEAQKARLIEYAAARSIIKSFVRSYTSRREEKMSDSVSIDSKPKELAVDSSTMTPKKLLLQQRNERIEFVRKNRRSSVRPPPRSPTSAATDLLPSS
jgi:rRNA processing protein Krr1/Pno1